MLYFQSDTYRLYLLVICFYAMEDIYLFAGENGK